MSNQQCLRLTLIPLLVFVVFNRPAAAQADQSETTPAADELVIEGIVIDPIGAGIAEAQVRIESPSAAATDPPLAETSTGSKGQITLTIKRPELDEIRVRITKDGFAEHVSTLDISDADEPPFIDATLAGAARIEGRITVRSTDESTDEPIAGAVVECTNGGRRSVVQTAADGTYTFGSIYAGRASLLVRADGYASLREVAQVADASVRVDMQLDREWPIELTVVTNTGEPADEVIIEAIVEPHGIHLSEVSDAKGKAVLHGVSPEAFGLRMKLNGPKYLAMKSYAEELELTGDHQGAMLEQATDDAARSAIIKPFKARITVTLASRVRGKIVDKLTSKPVGNVRVAAGKELRFDMPLDWSDDEGVYELEGVRPGIVTVTFQHEDYATFVQTVDLYTGKTGALDVSLDAGLPIGGVVVDEQDNPLEHVRIGGDMWQGFRTLGLRAVTGSNGRFRFPHAPAGEIEFTFVRPGFGEPKTERIESGKTDLKIVLEGASLPTEVATSLPGVDARLKPGQPVPDVTLTATDGTVYKLSELHGKYVMLDFWATWCRPCVAAIPHVKAVHEAMHDRPDFLLIGISLDTDVDALKKSCHNNGIKWPQVVGAKSGAGEAFEAFDGIGIPYVCLIGPDGKLIAQHMRGPQMADEIKKHLPATADNRK